MTAASSTAFSAASWDFLDQLAAENSKAFFDRNRAVYDEAILAPSRALVDDLATRLPESVHPGLRGEARVGRSLFRINRDVRFSKDKTPYKTHVDLLFWVGEGAPRERPACILRLTAEQVLLGAGQTGLRGTALDRYRAAVADEDRGTELRGIVDELVTAQRELSEPSRARPPRPYPADHPNSHLLRRDGFHVSETHAHPAAIVTPTFGAWCASRLAPYRPLLDWLAAVDTTRP